ncbi:MAG: hypothetical protein ACTSSH_12720 [Candidatus Heimdallarchaeota archaeon]
MEQKEKEIIVKEILVDFFRNGVDGDYLDALNIAIKELTKELALEEFNDGYIRGCEDTEANYKANT